MLYVPYVWYSYIHHHVVLLSRPEKGSSEPETPAKMARTSWMAPSGTSRSTTTWAASMDDTSRASSGPSSTSTDCWRGSIHHALAVMEHRGEEISSLFDQLHEIETDLTSMNNQVGQVSHSLQQCKRRPGRHPQPSPIYSSQSVSSLHRQNSFSSFTSRHNRRSSVSSCRELNNLTEDEMEYIVHRLLKRICELSLGRQEGRDDIPLIVWPTQIDWSHILKNNRCFMNNAVVPVESSKKKNCWE